MCFVLLRIQRRYRRAYRPAERPDQGRMQLHQSFQCLIVIFSFVIQSNTEKMLLNTGNIKGAYCDNYLGRMHRKITNANKES